MDGLHVHRCSKQFIPYRSDQQMNKSPSMTRTGQYSPLRYPGGKGKIAKFVNSIAQHNNLNDIHYVEPFAGGAGIAWELLITGTAKRVSINDINIPIYAFWKSVVNQTDELCRLISDVQISLDSWNYWKNLLNSGNCSDLELGFAFFFLNRTNRSGIIKGGLIGGKRQEGKWKMDSRFNKCKLVSKIEKIAQYRDFIDISNIDAIEFLRKNHKMWNEKKLVYLDPPYIKKGKTLYDNYFEIQNHIDLASEIKKINHLNWIVSYDDVKEVYNLYRKFKWLKYSLSYSAQNRTRGNEIMFFCDRLNIPDVTKPMIELYRSNLH